MPLPHSYMPSIPQLPQPSMAKPARRRERPKERWLLTRKTWKYMSDAGRRLIPEGSHNRPEDIPKIEAYFQDVCQREPRFLLWRKSSYPGAIPKPRKKRVRGGSVRARSPDDAPIRPTDLMLHTSGGRFDMAKMRRDFFAPSGTLPPFSSEPAIIPPSSTPVDDDESTLVDLLRKYLKVEDASGPTKITDQDELVKTLRRYLKKQSEADSDGDRSGDRPRDSTQRSLLENLSRYYCRSPNRDNIVQDLLTDRNLLKRLYHDLRKTRPYRGRGYTPYTSTPGPSSYISGRNLRNYDFIKRVQDGGDPLNFRTSPPPLIEVSHESLEDKYVDCGTQTLPIPEEVLLELEQAYRDKLEAQSPTSPTSPTSPSSGKPARRRSSVDHDDVSQSVSDTIKRYLRMARKKSVDAEKPDRFKRINYDKNLRNIKPKPYNDVDDDGPHKGCQTDEAWILTYRDLSFSSLASSPTSPPPSPLPGSTHGFLSSLLGRSTPTFASAGGIQNANVPAGGMHKSLSVNTVSMDGPGGMQTAGGMQSGAGGMQKSRSTSSVVSSVSKRLWRTRSRSSSRVSASWMPQGSCCWADGAGRCVRLTSTSLLALSEIERRALQQAALARLQQFNIGTPVRIPEDCTLPASKPKRRAYLLKRKALTTGIFDQRTTKDGDKNKEPPGTFGVPLAQCVDTERALRLQRGSRASLASLAALDKDDSESCDSGDWTGSSVEEGGPRVPALVTSCLGHLRRHGMRTLGLFRVSASKKRVRQLREEWEQVQEAALDSAVCPHDVATLLKEFLRDLPDPLLCRDLYPAFLHTQKIRNRRLQWEALKLIVQLLPTAHRDTLNAILSFLAELASHAEDGREPGNKMDAANLATVFAPTILHRNKPDETVSVEQLSERADVINVVRQLIERQAELWALPAELLHEAYIHLAHTAPAHLDALLPRRVECVVQKAMATDGRRVWPRGALVSTTHATSRQEFSSGVGGSPATRDYHDNDSASDYNETLAGSDDDNCVITASLHIPAAFPQSQSQGPVTAPPRRRSTSSSSSAKRDSAVGSSSVSVSSSPPSSPPPAPLRVTVSTAGEIRTPADIDRLINLGRERNTSDARAVVLRQHDESKSVTKSGTTRTTSTRHEHNTRRHDHNTGMQELNTGRQELNTGRQELNKDLNTGRHDHHPGRIEHSSSRHRDLNTGRLEHSSSRHRDLHTGRIEHSSRPDYNPGRNEHMPGRSEQNSSRLESGIKESSSGRHSHTFGRQEPSSGRPDHDLGRLESAKDVSKKEENTVKRDVSSTTLYKRGELISSARTKSHHHNT